MAHKSKTITLGQDLEFKLPSTPNFLVSVDDEKSYSIKLFSEKQLREVGKLMVEDLIKKSKEKL